ncbi:CTP synthetase [Pseudomonas aeruginosa]|nr:CTP synthetase [Pseudomonas aeruginosa]
MSTPPAAPLRIALVGDHDPHITAHRAIPLALRLAGEALGLEIAFDWLASDRLPAEPALERYDGFWCVPGSPYRDADAVLRLIAHARAGAGRSSVPAPASSTRSSSSPATPSAGRRRPMARSIRTATRR